ncbi:hypothetical protein SRABI128_03208 [Microbacterium sp. Bi128]|nr:hypothetical protein SRABI128_03208 [Microbacterium sp. Bi128]
MFRALEADFRSSNASSWLQRFCAMMMPTATSITVRVSRVALRLAAVSLLCANRTARRRAMDVWWTKSRASSVAR